MAHIVSLVYQPVDQSYSRQPDSFLRVPVASLQLLAGYGIKGDAKAGRHPLRQLNVLSYKWLMARQQEGFLVAPGDFGEQVVIRGLAVDQLRPGDRIQIGPEACIEITMPRNGCLKLQNVQRTSAVLADGLAIGMLAKVVRSGVIKIGDAVKRQDMAQLPETA